MAEECIFCKIINNELPGAKVYEDDHTVAILDLHPVKKGHTLVIPKKHMANVLETDKETWLAVSHAAKIVAHAIMDSLGAEGFNLTINNGKAAGQAIDHLHVHLIPRQTGDGLKLWPHTDYADGEMQMVADTIKGALSL